MIKLETIKENFPHMIRFAPVSMVVALVLMLFGNLLILNVDIIDSIFHKEENFFKLLVLLGMSFFIFAWASLHQHGFSSKGKMVAYVVATLVVGYLGVELFFSTHHLEVVFFKSFFITAGFILGYIVVPFWKKKEENVQLLIYIHHLRYALLGSFRIGFLLVVGLLIISSTIRFLFDIGFEKFFTLIGFNGFFGYFLYLFISRLMQNPHDLRYNFKEEGEKSYVTFLLYAFTAVIFTALNLFVFKIILTQELPRGQVAWMVMGFSLFAFLSYLSLIPYREKVRKYGFLIWGTLLVQSFVLLGSVGVRVWEYGFTEKRYLLVAYGLWMMGISLYFLWQREKAKIFWLFASLWIVVLSSQIGPLSGYSVSRYSQQHRLDTSYQLFQKAKPEEKEELFSEMYSIMEYLQKYHGVESISSVVKGFTEEDILRYAYTRSFFGLKKGSEQYVEAKNSELSYTTRYKSVFDVREYDYFLTELYMTNSKSMRVLNEKTTLYFYTDVKNSEIIIGMESKLYKLSIKDLLDKIKNNRASLTESDMLLVFECESFKLLFDVTRIYRYSGLTVESNVFVKLKDKK